MKLKFLFLFALAAFTSTILGAPVGVSLGISGPLASGLVLAGSCLCTGMSTMQGITVNTAFTTTLLDSTYGNYYRDGSKNLKDLYQRLYYGSEFDKIFKLEYTKLNVYDKGITASEEVTQPMQTTFTPKGGLTFTPATSTLQKLKVDWKHSSEEIYGKWVGFLKEEGKSELEQPLVAYVMDILAKQHVEDVELKACYKGVRVAPTEGTAGAAADSIDGVRKKLNDGVTATTITPITTGALATDPADFVTQMEDFMDEVEALDRAQNMTLAMDDALARRFRRGMRVKYNSQYLQSADLDRLLDYPNIQVTGYQAMAGSSKIFCTPSGNAVKVINMFDQNMVRGKFQFEQEDRNLKAWMDYAMTYHFIDHSRVYCNEQTT